MRISFGPCPARASWPGGSSRRRGSIAPSTTSGRSGAGRRRAHSSTNEIRSVTRYAETDPFSTSTFCSDTQAPLMSLQGLTALLDAGANRVFEALWRARRHLDHLCDWHHVLPSGLVRTGRRESSARRTRNATRRASGPRPLGSHRASSLPHRRHAADHGAARGDPRARPRDGRGRLRHDLARRGLSVVAEALDGGPLVDRALGARRPRDRAARGRLGDHLAVHTAPDPDRDGGARDAGGRRPGPVLPGARRLEDLHAPRRRSTRSRWRR